MAAKRKPQRRRIRFVYRRSPTALKCLLLGMLLTGAVALLTLDTKEQLEDLRDQAAVLEQEHRELERMLSQKDTVQSVKELAVKLLGLVDPDTILFEPEQ